MERSCPRPLDAVFLTIFLLGARVFQPTFGELATGIAGSLRADPYFVIAWLSGASVMLAGLVASMKNARRG